jgi:predicted transglutaminase-like cysteine proteinase
MKKILTLLMAVGTCATLHAQTREETRRVILGERNDNDGYTDRDVVYGRSGNDHHPASYSNNRRYEMDQINQEYDNKIYSIRSNRYLSNAEKERMIRQLQRDRQQRIADVNRSFNNRNRTYDDDRYGRNDKGWNKKYKNTNMKKGNKVWFQ